MTPPRFFASLVSLLTLALVAAACGDSGDANDDGAGGTDAAATSGDAGGTVEIDGASPGDDEPEICDDLDESKRPCCADTCGDDWCQPVLCSQGRWVCEWPKKHIGDAFNGGECSSVCSSTPALGMLCSVDGWVCDPQLAGVWDACPAERKTVCYSCADWSPSDDDPCDCACESGVVKCGG